MMTVLGCIAYEHDVRLVIIAALICTAGSMVTIRLFLRAAHTQGAQRLGWHVLTAVAAGAAIWCTHFIAMLGFEPGVPVGFDPVATMGSLLIAIAGSTAGFALAASRMTRFAPLIGGAVLGLAVALMHYSGMAAYRVQGVVVWDYSYMLASIVLSVLFCAAALQVALRRGTTRPGRYLASGLLIAGIISLHFTGMTAFSVEPLAVEGAFSNPAALLTLAFAIAGVAAIIVVAGGASYLIDNSLRAESYDQLRELALNDSLTALPNRAHFNERLDAEIVLAQATRGQVALIAIDLDRFKEVNDLRGHGAGDTVLQTLGERIASQLREGEFAARLGGDEFAVLYRWGSQSGLMDLLTRLELALFRPIQLDGYEVMPGASMGVARYPKDGTDKSALINNADLALYRAKETPSQVICFYEPAMDEAVRARRSLARELRDALQNDRLDVHYQVQKNIASGEIRGYEALVRWPHPERGFIPPSEFIPLAEENGLILEIGEWVLRRACYAARTWSPPSRVAVNLSAMQFSHPDLPGLVADILAETGLPSAQLELELTESAIFVDQARSLQILGQIKALGVSIALDDFGTGYSSLETLRSFPFDKIKLDRSFVQEVETDPQAKAFIRAILALGKSLEIPVLAEGIETEGQLAILGTEGCDEAQGYLLGRPVPREEVIKPQDRRLGATSGKVA